MQNTRNPLIFIVEDSVVYKELIVGYIKSKNFQNIKTFSTIEDLVKEMGQKPDVIILDCTYRKLNGMELMIKTKETNPGIDFIFLSAQNDVEMAVKIMKLGAADYIVKNDKAPRRLVKSIEEIVSDAKKVKVRKGFKIGVVGFFIMLFIIIISIFLITILLDLEL